MFAPSTLPDEARAAAWRALWDYLVLEASRDLGPDPTDEPVDSDDIHGEGCELDALKAFIAELRGIGMAKGLRLVELGVVVAEELQTLAERLGDMRPPLLTVVCPTCVRKFDAALDPAPQEEVAS